jgi:tRNA pseudouridine65 synthase
LPSLSTNEDGDALDILYQDEHYVAIDKPPGLLVHRSPIDRHETRFALQLLRDQLGQYIYPIHRLDKPTSGVMLFALSSEAASAMAAQIHTEAVQKTYWAVVRGYAPEQGSIDYSLSYQADDYADKDRHSLPPAQEALTHFRRLAVAEIPVYVDRYPQTRYSLVELQPVTGRRHQLRRHMKHIGHPIIGDARHGKGVHNRYFQSAYQAHRLMLMSRTLRWQHPFTGASITCEARFDGAFTRVFEAFNWQALLSWDNEITIS